MQSDEELSRLHDSALLLGIDAVEDYAIFMLDLTGRIATWNRGAQRIKGWTAAEIIGRHFSVFYPEEERGACAGALEVALQVGRFEREGWRLRKDGSRFWANVVITRARGDGGAVFGFVKVTRDLTERRAAEENAQRLAQEQAARAAAEGSARVTTFLARVSQALSSTLDYDTALGATVHLALPLLGDVCFVDVVEPGGKIRRVGETALDPAKEPLLHRLRQLIPAVPRAGPIRSAVASGEAQLLERLDEATLRRYERTDEEIALIGELGLRTSLSVPLIARGRILGALTFAMAESGRRYTDLEIQLAEELGRRAGLAIDNALLFAAEAEARARAEAREAELVSALRVRDDFLAIAGHELKTPLAALLMQLQSLERRIVKEGGAARLRERLAKAAGAGRRLERLINELLDVSRITMGRLKLEPEAVDLVALVRDVIAEHTEVAGAPIVLRADAPAIVGAWDPLRLQQVVSNLLENALKYGEHAPVEVELARAGGQALLRVVDHGIGIRPEDQERIFEHFERAVSSKDYRGAGLGLWISRQIVEASGGHIGVQSSPGEGAIFEVLLPLVGEEHAHAAS